MSTWQHLRFAPTPAYPVVHWSPAIEMDVEHRRSDRRSSHPLFSCALVDRHLESRKPLAMPVWHRDMPGNDETPDGITVSLASGPRDPESGQGGEIHDSADGRTRWQRDWDFLSSHAVLARERFRSASLPLMSFESYMRDEHAWTTWRTVSAYAAYAANFKTRTPDRGVSSHAVDTLVRSFHCAGAAEVLFALCMISGIPARRISTSNHSTVEVCIDGHWVWIDNMISGTCVTQVDYQEMLLRLGEWAHLSERQRRVQGTWVGFYRSPYQFDQCFARSLNGGLIRRFPGATKDVAGRGGLSLGYDPSTATMLYPGRPEHIFACQPGPSGGPLLTLNPKQSWLHLPLDIAGSAALRSSITLSDCADNPITGAVLRIWVGPGTPDTALAVTLNGRAIDHGRSTLARGQMPAIVYDIRPDLLHGGSNEVIVRAAEGSAATVLLYPDLRTDPVPCALAATFIPQTSDVRTDPSLDPGSA